MTDLKENKNNDHVFVMDSPFLQWSVDSSSKERKLPILINYVEWPPLHPQLPSVSKKQEMNTM